MSIRIFGASGDTSSGDKDTLSDETIKHPKLTTSQLGFVGEDGYGSIIFNFRVANTNNTEPYEKIEFKTNDFTKGTTHTNLKSRENEMKVKNFENEIFKYDPCSKSKTRKDKI